MAMKKTSRQNICPIVTMLSLLLPTLLRIGSNIPLSTPKILSFTYLSDHTKTLNYIRQTTEQRKRVRMGSKPRGWMLFLLFSPVVAILVIGILNFNDASAQGEQNAEQYVVRRIDIWGLFYRLMVAAFVVGSVVQGSIVYVCWRFRESNPKNRVRESLEGAHQ
jgi:cytochrome b